MEYRFALGRRAVRCAAVLLILGAGVGTALAVALGSKVVAIIPVSARAPCAGVYAYGKLWVTDYGSGAVSSIDARTNRLVGRNIPIGNSPCGIVAGGGSLWINGYGTNSVERVSPTRRKLTSHIPVGVGPYDVAYGFGSVWTTNNGSQTVSRIDPSTNRVIRTISIPQSNPTGLSITAGAVWVGENSGTSVHRIDPATNAVRTYDVGCSFPAWFAANQTELWVACNADGLVLHLDPQSGKVLTTVKVAGFPQDGTIAQDGSVWVPNQKTNVVTRIDPATGATQTVKVGRMPFVLNVGAGDVWAPSFGGADVRRIHSS